MATIDLHSRLISTGLIRIKPEEMATQDTQGNIVIETENGEIVVRYSPKTERTIYDICDLSGRVIKTGVISDEVTSVDSSDLFGCKYVMLIVDGDKLISKSFEVAA